MRVCTFLFALLICGAQGFALPSLVWDSTEIQVRLEPGVETARATFTATNAGREPIRFSSFQTSCGCTAAVVENHSLNPGASTSIEATFSKGGRQGLRRNQIRVFVDDVKHPVATLLFTVEIPRVLSIQPAVLFWTQNAAQAPRTVNIELDGIHVTEIERMQYNETTLKLEGPLPGGTPRQLSITVEPTQFDQPLRETIVITARGPDGFEEEARVQIFVQP